MCLNSRQLSERNALEDCSDNFEVGHEKNYEIIDEKLGVRGKQGGDSAGSRLVVFQSPKKTPRGGLILKSRNKTSGKSCKETLLPSVLKKLMTI